MGSLHQISESTIASLPVVLPPRQKVNVSSSHRSPLAWIAPVSAVAFTVCLLIVVIIAANRSFISIEFERSGAAETVSAASDTLSVMIWNLGYGGLGAESDFVSDGGDHLLPPDRATVAKNISGVRRFLEGADVDVVLLQEVAGASFLTRGESVRSEIEAIFDDRDNAFSADFRLRFLPRYYAPRHGLFSSVRIADVERSIIRLPEEPGYLGGLTRRLYHTQLIRVPFAGGEWSILNVHLSAFDEGADVRTAQLEAVLALAEAEYARGRHVVIGGDWNLEFDNPGRPSTTSEEDLFWLHPFPADRLKTGWKAAFDPATPTVRTNNKPYRAGENYTTVIDGFVVSPNVEAVAVSASDLDFQFADHQPVTARFRAKDQ